MRLSSAKNAKRLFRPRVIWTNTGRNTCPATRRIQASSERRNLLVPKKAVRKRSTPGMLWRFVIIVITFISIAQIQQFSFQMRFTILEEIKSTLPKSLLLQSLFTNQIRCWFLMRGENRSTRGKTSHSRGEYQQTQSTYDTGCGNRTRATLVEGKCSHH